MYDLTPYLRKGDNLLAVRLDHSDVTDSRWYIGSGIYRDVYLIEAPATQIAQWGVGYRLASLTPRRARMDVDEAVTNPVKDLRIETRVTDAAGTLVASASRGAVKADNSLSLSIHSPKLWDVDHPYLYTLRLDLLKDGRRIDGTDVPLGIRSISVSPDADFFLNGRPMKVKGVCLHHDAGVLGAVVPRQVWEHRLRNLKHQGVNAIRMSHNPQALVLYQLCDSLGFLIMDEASDEWEFPKRKWVEGWNVGTPAFGGSYDFFEKWIDRDVADMVRRNRIHPSVVFWSIGNEVD